MKRRGGRGYPGNKRKGERKGCMEGKYTPGEKEVSCPMRGTKELKGNKGWYEGGINNRG